MKILFVEPNDHTLFSFRKELLDKLLSMGNEVVLCTQNTPKVESEYRGKVFDIVDVKMNLKNTNIFKNLSLKKEYKNIIFKYKPDLILSFSIKPNIYCGMYSKNIPIIANVTGLGNIFKKSGLLNFIGVCLYKRATKKIDYVFFQNQDGYDFFTKHKIKINNYKIIPGSGVNTSKYVPNPLVERSNTIKFLFASRAIKEKGFDLLLNSIPAVIEKNKNVHFYFLTAEEEIKTNTLFNEINSKYSEYITLYPRNEKMENVYPLYDFLVSPSYYREGISNVLLESLSCGRPIITTIDNPGCKEIIRDGVNGYGVKSKDLDSLIDALIKASKTSREEIDKMGKAGREFVINFFNKEFVIKEYLDTINILMAK